MFINSGLFWFLMGMLTVLIAAGFKAYAADRGWELKWWKWLLFILWYAIFILSIFAFGTLTGESEGGAGIKMLLLGLFVCIVYGAGLLRLMSHKTTSRQTTNP